MAWSKHSLAGTILLLCLLLFFTNNIFLGLDLELTSDLLKHITWRGIGPAAFGGRIDDIEAVVQNPNIIFVGAASGGIFKSKDNGMTWKPVFDEKGTSLSIGDIAIAPSDPAIIWAGTGEANQRQSSSWGDGVYKSLDGGETWMFMGLKDTHHIGRIVIHPQNPDIVYVAALGHQWGGNLERGLFRTTDGGMTWKKILYINEFTGIVDVAMEQNGRILYAAAYQRLRKAWGFIGGGPNSALYRSMDGGETWIKLSKGFPEGDVGRIGVDISLSHPHIVYAFIEHDEKGGLYRSEDRGESWTWMNSLNRYPAYYGQVRVDPFNPNKVWALFQPLYLSIDGGKTFTSEGIYNRVHSDHHALWINPGNPDHLLLGTDGGFYMSYNGSRTWAFIDNLPIAQFYAIGIDNRDPYWVYGGAQDNGTFGLPSRTFTRLGIQNSDILCVAYGDGFYVVVDPRNPNQIYTENQEGRLLFKDIATNEERVIRPAPEDFKEEYRWNWNCPLVISPHDPSVLYYGGNRLLKTSDKGQSWEVISPDLSKNLDWMSIPFMGFKRSPEILKKDTAGIGPKPLSRDYGIEHYGTITTISESPLQPNLIYVGTDDGNVQLTLDGGKTWQNLTGRFPLSGPRYVTRVLASKASAGTAYVTFDGHYDDDFKPYIFKTTDFGKVWKSIAGDIPEGMTVNVLAEHPRNPNLLFAGTEFGLFISINGGVNWILAGANLPRVPIDDIVVNARDNDLILGTHGRGFYILDDIAMLEHMNKIVLESESYLFPPRVAIQYFEKRPRPDPGTAEFSGPNPEYGALLTYYLKDGPPTGNGTQHKSQVKIKILDDAGHVIRELEGPDRKGLNRISWDLRYPLSFDPTGVGGAYYDRKGPFVLPAEYTVKLIARSKEQAAKLNVRMDPALEASPETLQARFEASMTASDLQRAFVEGRKVAQEMEKEIDRIRKILKTQKQLSGEVQARVDQIGHIVAELKHEFRGGWGPLEPEFAIMELAGSLQTSTYPPNQSQLRTMERYLTILKDNFAKINNLIEKGFPELQRMLFETGLTVLQITPLSPPERYNKKAS